MVDDPSSTGDFQASVVIIVEATIISSAAVSRRRGGLEECVKILLPSANKFLGRRRGASAIGRIKEKQARL